MLPWGPEQGSGRVCSSPCAWSLLLTAAAKENLADEVGSIHYFLKGTPYDLGVHLEAVTWRDAAPWPLSKVLKMIVSLLCLPVA